MTSRAKRLTLTIGVAALVAVIAVSVMAPSTVAAPKSEREAPGRTSFVITTEEPFYMDGTTSLGTFKATGAIRDAGSALSSTDPDLWLGGRKGTIHIDLEGDTFVIIAASPAYAHTVGATGTYQGAFEWGDGKKGGRPSDGGPRIGTITMTLEGSLP